MKVFSLETFNSTAKIQKKQAFFPRMLTVTIKRSEKVRNKIISTSYKNFVFFKAILKLYCCNFHYKRSETGSENFGGRVF